MKGAHIAHLFFSKNGRVWLIFVVHDEEQSACTPHKDAPVFELQTIWKIKSHLSIH